MGNSHLLVSGTTPRNGADVPTTPSLLRGSFARVLAWLSAAWEYRDGHQHATIEKDVRELLYDYPLGKIPTDDWVANVAFFQILLFAYNLVHWFKRLCLPKEYLYATLDTIRTDFLVLPAKLIRQGNRNVLVLPRDYHHQAEFKAALRKIEKLRLP